MKIHRLVLPTLLGIALAIALLSAAVRQSQAALVIDPATSTQDTQPAALSSHLDNPQAAVRYVATSGVDSGACTDSANPCRTVQYAVDRAVEEDEVRVAGGVYTEAQIRPRQDITTTGYVTQVVYISKTISIQGGYTVTNWINPDPNTNPTVLDAQGQGRVVYITGLVSPTIEGIVITGGDSINQGGWYIPGLMADQDVGGGLYIITASATISNCEISLNSSPDYGGGAALVSSSIQFAGNHISTNNSIMGGGVASFLGYNNIISNTFTNNTGGGLYLGGEFTVQTGNEHVVGNTFETNTGGLGAGIELWFAPPAIISSNTLLNNTADQGGGIYSFHSDPTLSGNRILANQANRGGGLYLLQYFGIMDSNVVASNTADSAGGFYLDGGAPTVSNNIITDNHSESYAGGMAIDISHHARFMNNTIANNTGGDGIGITVMSNSQVTFTNTIIVSQSVGIDVSSASNGNTVFMEGTLWGSGIWANGQDWAGSGTIFTGTVNVWGDPGFVNPENGDYHIDHDSAAVDAGVDAGVYTDIDGEPRPFGAGFDIGADELPHYLRYVSTTGADSGDCTDSANPCRTVQYAVNQAAEGDEVRVASGAYSQVNDYGGLAQVIYLTKTLTIQGGYTLTNWITPDPVTNPTILDAQRLGQVVYITGTVSSTLSGMHITGGQPHGIQITNASVILTNNQVYGNSTAGIRVDSFPAEISAVTLEGNTLHDNPIGLEAYYSRLYMYDNAVQDNGAPGSGMGAYLLYSQATLQGNLFTGNQGGGGIEIQAGTATLISNTFISNSADLGGGAISIAANEALLEDNTVLGNTSGSSGGGIYGGNSLTLRGNRIGSNTSAQYGGGVYLLYSDALLEENILLDNSAGVMGGGLFSSNSSPQLLDNHLENNRSSWGGGAMLTGSPLISPIISGNIFLSNTAQSVGGGLLLDYGDGAIEGNTFRFNVGGQGGGMYLNNSPASLANNVFTANASDQGGGIYLYYSNAALNGNIFEQNTADDSGGGLYLLDSHARIDQNRILYNLAGQYGGGLHLSNSSPTLTNNIIADNQSLEAGNGIFIHSPRRLYTPITLIHNTIARNNGGYGSGILLAEDTDIVLSNTIIVSHSIGIDTGYSNNSAIMEGTLWGSGAWANGQDWAGNGTIITGTVNIWGDPAFVDPDGGDYHISFGSAAVDAGVEADIYTDIDGEPRPFGAGFDIGADELQAGTRYVATTGVDSGACTDFANPCRTVQYAVDQAAEGDEVRVASGVYSDIHIRPRQDITTTGYVTQVVYISKTISIQGGYTLTNWISPDPDANPTILDAQGQGRVVYITGHISPLIEGFQITGGDATGLGGEDDPAWISEFDTGAGIYIHQASAIISALRVIHNTFGGGIHLSYSSATIQGNYIAKNDTGGITAYQGNNTIIRNKINSNEAVGGAGFKQTHGDSIVIDNLFISNTAQTAGGAIFLNIASSELISNQIVTNIATEFNGGALFADDSILILRNNTIHANSSPENSGGGLEIWDSSLVMDGNIVSNNSAHTTGGILLDDTNARLVNNIIVENDSASYGAGIAIIDQYPPVTQPIELIHNTITRNTYQGEGGGVVVASGSVTLTNNIIVSHTTGILVYSGGLANLDSTLWGSGAWANGQDWDGNGTIITGTVNVWGDPGFVDPDHGNYHIRHGSAAVDAGVEADIYTDIDGEPRPAGAGFDIGADELQAGTRYVATTGADSNACTDFANPCRTVQYAVDQAVEGDEIRVAGGTYAGVKQREGITQTIYISKTILIGGGYTLTNWITPDPSANPTVLDAQGLGRVVYISGAISPTLTGLRITGGDATELGGYIDEWGYAWDAGGGIYIHSATATISNSQIYSNTSPDFGAGIYVENSCSQISANSIYDNLADYIGGGLLLENSSSMIHNNFISNNTADNGGGLTTRHGANTILNNIIQTNIGLADAGGIYLEGSSDYLAYNEIISNTALQTYNWGAGGGLMLYDSPAILEGNTIKGNHSSQGGGLHIYYSDATLKRNIVAQNIAVYQAGGMYLLGSNARLNGNRISDNTSGWEGGGIFIGYGNTTLTNNVIVENFSSSLGSGIAIDSPRGWFSPTLLMHNTVARNSGGYGIGILLLVDTDVVLSNTILVSQTIGIETGIGNNTAIMEGTLWGSGAWANGQDWVGEGIVTGTVNIWGNPGFIDPDNGDYHIGYGSAGRDAGIDVGVYTDIDGEPRPVGAGFDIGADELQASLSIGLSASPNPVASGGNLTYTLILTNTGAVELHAIITATLPAQVTPGGSLTWSADLPAGSDPWMGTVVVMVDPSYAGVLTSTLEAISLQGARQVVTSTVTAIQPVSGLATLNSSPSPLGQPTSFTATITAGSDLQFEWDFGDGTSGAGQSVEHIYPTSGVYTATITASNAVSSQSEPMVVIIQEAIAGLSVAASSPTVLGQVTAFTATLTAGSNASFSWDFGDGASGSGSQTYHTYIAAGEYTVTVTASNLVSLASASTSVKITQPDHDLYLPIITKASWNTNQQYIDLSRYFQLLQ